MLIHSYTLSFILEYSLDDIEILWPSVYKKLDFDSRRLGMRIKKYTQKFYELCCEKQFVIDLSKTYY